MSSTHSCRETDLDAAGALQFHGDSLLYRRLDHSSILIGLL